MEAKNTGAVMATIFFIVMCAIIGSCFMAFVYEDKKVSVNDPKIVSFEGLQVINSKDENITSVKLSSSKLGLKPATGKEDSETEIPSTVTAQNGSEGLYGKFEVKSNSNWKLYVTNVTIDSKVDSTSEREHIQVGLLDVKNSVVTLEQDKTMIASGEASDEFKEFTLLVWLHASAGNSLIGANISFDLVFEIA